MTKEDLIPYYFLMTKDQSEELKELYKSLDCETATEFFTKMIEFGKVISKMHQQDWEFLLIDKKEMEVITNPKTHQVMMLFNSKKSYDVVTNDIKEIMDLKKQISITNNFGQPISNYKS